MLLFNAHRGYIMKELNKVKENAFFKLRKDGSLYYKNNYLGNYNSCKVSLYPKGCLVVWMGLDQGFRDYVFYNNNGDVVFDISTYSEDRHSGNRYKNFDVNLTIYDELIIAEVIKTNGERSYIASDYAGKRYKGENMDAIKNLFSADSTKVEALDK